MIMKRINRRKREREREKKRKKHSLCNREAASCWTRSLLLDRALPARQLSEPEVWEKKKEMKMKRQDKEERKKNTSTPK